MQRRIGRALGVTAVMVGVLLPLDAVRAQGGYYGGADPYIAGNLEIGLRMSYFRFRDAERETVGPDGVPTGGFAAGISTFRLDEEQNYIPYPYVRYNFTEFVGVQLGWEFLEGKTRTRNVLTGEMFDHSNGNVVLQGPSLLLYGRYPFEGFMPYAGVGIVYFFGSFDHDSGWHAGGQRNMAVDDTVGFLVSLGSSFVVYENLQADVSVSHVTAEPDARFWLRGDSSNRAEWKFPMDSWLFQVGLKYAF